MDYNSIGAKMIEEMSRDDFHQRIIRDVCRLTEFGHLVSAGAGDLAEDEKQTIRKVLARAGIPFSATETDAELDGIATAIASRSVQLR